MFRISNLLVFVSLVLLLSCQMTRSNLIKRSLEEMGDASKNNAILIVSPTISGLFPEDKLNIIFNLYDFNSKAPKNHKKRFIEVTIVGFKSSVDNGKYYYLKVKPGSYGLDALTCGISSSSLNTMECANFLSGDLKFDWDMGLKFQKEKIELKSGEYYYLGDYEITCQRSDAGNTRVFKMEGLKVLDHEERMKEDMSQIFTGSSFDNLRIVKALNLLNDINKLEYKKL